MIKPRSLSGPGLHACFAAGLLVLIVCGALSPMLVEGLSFYPRILDIENGRYWDHRLGFGYPFPLVHVDAELELNPFYWIVYKLHLDEIINVKGFEIYQDFDLLIYASLIFKFFMYAFTALSMVILLRDMEISWLLVFMGSVTFLLSGFLAHYFLKSHQFMYALHFWLLPTLMFLLRRICLQTNDRGAELFWAILFTFTACVAFLSGHAGSFYTSAFGLAVIGLFFVIADPRKIWILLCSLVFIVLITGSKTYYVFDQISYFTHGIRPPTPEASVLTSLIYDGIFRPLFRPSFGEIWSAYQNAGVIDAIYALYSEFRVYNHAAGFFWVGPIVSLTAIYTVATVYKKHDPFVRGVIVAFVLYLLSALAPIDLHLSIPTFAAIFLGPAAVFAIVIAAWKLNVIFNDPRRQRVIRSVTALQIFLMIVVALQVFPESRVRHNGIIEPVPDTWMLAILDDAAERLDNSEPFVKICSSPYLHEFDAPATSLEKSDYSPLIAKVCTGSRITANEVFSPSGGLHMSPAVDRKEVFDNKGFLDVAGIRYLILSLENLAAPQTMKFMGRYRAWDGRPVRIYKNSDSWPLVSILDKQAAEMALQIRPGCAHDRVTCRDFDALKKLRDPSPVRTTMRNGRFHAQLTAQKSVKIAFVSQMYRPGWQAVSGGGDALDVFPIFGGFVGVALPAGTTNFEFRYSPDIKFWSRSITVFGLGLFGVLSVIACLILIFRFFGKANPTGFGPNRQGSALNQNATVQAAPLKLISKSTLHYAIQITGLAIFATLLSLVAKFIGAAVTENEVAGQGAVNNLSFYTFCVVLAGPYILAWWRWLRRAETGAD